MCAGVAGDAGDEGDAGEPLPARSRWGDNAVRASIWSDDDVTLWPGEPETPTVSHSAVDLNGSWSVISVSGRNLPKLDIPVS